MKERDNFFEIGVADNAIFEVESFLQKKGITYIKKKINDDSRNFRYSTYMYQFFLQDTFEFSEVNGIEGVFWLNY